MRSRLHLHILVAAVRHAIDASIFVCRFVAFHLNPLWIYLSYFVLVDLLGFAALVALKPSNPEFSPRYVDMFFLSTSAVTVTGLATIRMEDLSSSQIVVLTLLMLVGSEMFISLLSLLLEFRKQDRQDPADRRVSSVTVCNESQLEAAAPASRSTSCQDFKKSFLQYLISVVLVCMFVVVSIGSLLVFLYMAHVSSAREVLTRKRINIALFSTSVTVSSFTNGGLLPTNESMAVFATNRGLLLLLIGQILAGNTLFPAFLRLVVWALGGLTRAEELEFMLNNSRAIGFYHLMPNSQTIHLAATAVALVATTVVLFCGMNWNSPVFHGLTSDQKIINALFMAVNARHAGENSIDCALIAPAASVLFIVMMYLPASTTLSPRQDDDETSREEDKNGAKRRSSWLKRMVFSPLSCNAVLIIAACFTERRSLSKDPLNFSTFNVIFEVISGYGNVGLSTGYSCSRLLQLHPGSICHDNPYSFSGWWSDEGKLVLVLAMFYGRLKNFRERGR